MGAKSCLVMFAKNGWDLSNIGGVQELKEVAGPVINDSIDVHGIDGYDHGSDMI